MNVHSECLLRVWKSVEEHWRKVCRIVRANEKLGIVKYEWVCVCASKCGK